MKRLKDILEGAAPKPTEKTGSSIFSGLSSIGTAFNQALNPIRRGLGVQTADLPAGKKEVDYGAALNTLDKAMSGFGGADPGKKSISEPPKVSGKIQDRVPQEVPRSNIDKAPERNDSVALQRQQAGDKSPIALSPQDRLKMMKMQSDKYHDDFNKKMEADFQAAQNKKLAPASNEKSPVDKSSTVTSGNNLKKITNTPTNDKTVSSQPTKKSSVPVPTARPPDLNTGKPKEPRTVDVKKGTTYYDIAKKVAKERGTNSQDELKKIMKANRQKATSLKIGSKIVIPEEYDDNIVKAIMKSKKGKKKC